MKNTVGTFITYEGRVGLIVGKIGKYGTTWLIVKFGADGPTKTVNQKKVVTATEEEIDIAMGALSL